MIHEHILVDEVVPHLYLYLYTILIFFELFNLYFLVFIEYVMIFFCLIP
ncbi:hypothetical protein MITSMUL_04450 [Mitsuokella multacida DSM 20544]|uniref:Uncharacterized protein n=1 Tax=Mitsuokella multacida DSM 20544 TaxID=500635 RepID=C9KML3_9FIRM|nr:hypothetical protein MITSMUL_04450 [Mitsuokella multacida DSM 20544]